MIKAAVIGCGRMGAQPSARSEGQVPAGWLPLSHIEALRLVAGVELRALCDCDVAALRRWGAHYGMTSLYADYRQLLERVRPELLTLATRTPAKAEIIRCACEHGVKAIYVEKPLANSIADCTSLLAQVRESGVALGYGVNRRYHSVYRHARELIRDGKIGRVVEIVVEHGPGALLWMHPHSVDLILFLLGSTDFESVQARVAPETLTASSHRVIDSDPLIEHASFRFTSGATAIIGRSGGLSVRVCGTEGNLTVHANGAFIQLDRRDTKQSPYFLETRTIHPIATRSATLTALEELVQAVCAGCAPGIDAAEIEVGTRMLVGCIWSHLNRSAPVRCEDIPTDLVVTGRDGDRYA